MMKIEWLVADVTPVRSPARAERNIFGMTLTVFWPIQAVLGVGKPLYDTETRSWLVVDVTPVGFPSRVECDSFGMTLDVFRPVRMAECDIFVVIGDSCLSWSIEVIFVVGEPLYDLGVPSWSIISFT